MSYKLLNIFGALLGENIVGRDSSLVFKADTRRSVDFPDLTELQSKVKANEPYLNLLIAKQPFEDDYLYVDYNDIIEISDITHEGESTVNYEITGNHQGNNDFVLEITQGGPLGTAMYKIASDGGQAFSAPQSIPGNGQISVDDGTTIIFSEGNLVSGDRYLWSTTSIRKELYQTDSFKTKAFVHIHAKDKAELIGDDNFTGYIDQLIELVSQKRGFHDGDYIYKLSLDLNTQPHIGEDGDLCQGVVTLFIEGSLYMYKEVQLIGSVDVEVLS